MYVYQKKARERIKSKLRSVTNLIERQTANKIGESDTRMIVVTIMSNVLGWDQFEHLTGEYAIKGGYADFLLSKDEQPLAVIEVKPVTLQKLKEQHIRQARDYAINEGIDWVILTTGNQWQVYRIYFEDKVPDTRLVFSLTLTNSDMKPAKKTELLYLLSEEAFRKNEIEDYYQRRLTLQPECLSEYLLSKETLSVLRNTIRKKSDQRLDLDEIGHALINGVISSDALPENAENMIGKELFKPQRRRQAKEVSTPDAAEKIE